MVPIERLDELVRMVGEAAASHLRVGLAFTERLGVDPLEVAEFCELSRLLNGLQEGAMRTRMVPVSTITDSLQRAVRDAARTLGKDVRWEVRGEDTELDRGVLQQLSGPSSTWFATPSHHGIDGGTGASTGRQAGAGRGAPARHADGLGGHHRGQRRRRRRRPRAGARPGDEGRPRRRRRHRR
jgi:two-component system chemotaxis sensor kinase CheA